MSQATFQFIPLHRRIIAGQRMVLRKQSGETVTRISSSLNISRSHLYVLEQKYIEDPSMQDKARGGRPPKVNEYLRRRVIRELQKNPFKSAAILTHELNEQIEEEKQISVSTTKRIAKGRGLIAYRPCYKPPLDRRQVQRRLDFAYEYGDRDLRPQVLETCIICR